MKRLFFLSFIFLSLMSLSAVAQSSSKDSQERARWIKEIRSYKHDFMVKELDLSKDQQRQFFPLFDKMEDEIERINSETRELEAKADKPDATTLELENAARTIFEQRRAEGQVEMTFFEKFKEILTPVQLVKLKGVERKFNQNLMKSHRRTHIQKAHRPN